MSATTQTTDAQSTPASIEDSNKNPVVAIVIIVVGLLVIIGIAVLLVVRRIRKNKEAKQALEDIVIEKRDSLFDTDDDIGLTIQERVQNMEAENGLQGVDNSGFYQVKGTRTSVARTPSGVIVPKKAIFKGNAYSTENIAVESSKFGSGAASKEDTSFVY